MKKKTKPRISLMFRIGILFILAFALTSSVALINSRNYFKRMAALETKETFQAGAESAIELINPDTIEEQLAEDIALRMELREKYREICLRSGMEYILLYTVDKAGAKRYLISAGSTDELDEKVNKKRGYGAVLTSSLRKDQIRCLSGQSEAEMTFFSGEYNCVWTRPVYDSNGDIWGLLSCIYSVDHIIEMMNYYRAFILATVAILTGVSVLLALVLLRVVVFSRIKELAEGMKGFAKEKKIVYKAKQHMYSDEITDIEESFETMVKDITEYVDNIETLTSEMVENQTQLDIATRIQEGVVPKSTGFKGKSYDVYGMAIPATEVGGDFYDIFFLNDDELCVVIGDVSGKGISAALFMMVVKCALKEKLKAGVCLEDAMNQTNKDACVSNSECMFATVFAAILNIKTGVLKYANAGHNPPFILSKEIKLLDMDSGIAIGVFDDILIREDELTLKPGEGLFIYTDGITEALNISDELFGTDRLRDALEELKQKEPELTAKDCCEKIVEKTDTYRGERAQFDDITCLTVMFRKRKEEG